MGRRTRESVGAGKILGLGYGTLLRKRKIQFLWLVIDLSEEMLFKHSSFFFFFVVFIVQIP